MERNRVFALEGLDGVGKSTTGKILAEQTGNKYLYCMDGNRLRCLRKRFDTAPTPIRFLYYLAVPLDNYSRIERLRKNSDVFVDRTIASSIAYHRAYGLSESWLRLVPDFIMRQIDLMIYLTLSEETRRQRMKARSVTPETMTKSDEKSLLLVSSIDEAYKSVFPDKTLILPTDYKTPQQVVDKLKAKIYG